MIPTQGSGTPDHGALVAAADWFALLESEEATEADRRQWRQWLDQAPSHRQAWALVEKTNADFALAASGPARQALDSAGQSRRAAMKSLLGIGLAVPALWLFGRSDLVRTWNSDLETTTGEIRETTLADGSRLWLDTHSAVRLEFTESRRTIILQNGALHLHTGEDPRPLEVVTDLGRIQPIGTQFTVAGHQQPLEVAVSEGAVEITLHNGSARTLKAGEKALVTGSAMEVSPVSETDFAWTQRRLVVDNMPLEQFVERLNRYHSGLITVTPEAARLRVVGAYPLDQLDRVLNAMEDSLPVQVRRITPWFVVISV